MGARKILTDAGIRALIKRAKQTGKPKWQADGAIPKTWGGMQVLADPSGSVCGYYRYSDPDGKKPRLPLGLHTFGKGDGVTNFTLSQFRERVGELAALYMRPESRDVRAYLTREERRKAAAAEAAERERQTAEAAAAAEWQATLAKLIDVYVAHLKQQGKESARAVENALDLHVVKAHPAIAANPANQITALDGISPILRALVEAGKGRQAAKVRAYLNAAYTLALKAPLDANLPVAFAAFKITANPVIATGALSDFNRTLERALSEPELREYWAALKAAAESPARDALQLNLILGGQRTAQLLRVTVGDVDLEARTITLRDGKGKRKKPRLHLLPLSDIAIPVVRRCLARAKAQETVRVQQPAWLFSTHGTAQWRPEALTAANRDIAAALLAKPNAQRVIREAFQLRDIRRTCETRLAALGVSKDLRAQIQSHGLGGVQARHYDRHDYMPEKAAALAAWAKFLEIAPADNVAHIGERRTRRGGNRAR